MKKEKIYVPEYPKLHCSKCKREVFQTIHSAREYWVDWYRSFDTGGKVICIDCYKKVKVEKYDTSEYEVSLKKNPNLLGKNLTGLKL
jgi:hypothetical protein